MHNYNEQVRNEERIEGRARMAVRKLYRQGWTGQEVIRRCYERSRLAKMEKGFKVLNMMQSIAEE